MCDNVAFGRPGRNTMASRWLIWTAQLVSISILGSGILAGCVSTGVVSIAKDTYMISKQSATGFESAVGVQGEVLKEANQFCAKQGLVMVLVSLNAKDGVPGRSYATAELVFRAVRS